MVAQITGDKFNSNFVNSDWLVLMIFIEVYSFECDWWEVIIGSDNFLVPNGGQATIKTNDDQFQHIHAALDEWTPCSFSIPFSCVDIILFQIQDIKSLDTFFAARHRLTPVPFFLWQSIRRMTP